MNITKEFKEIRELLQAAEDKAIKGVGMSQKKPIVESRSILRTVKKKIDAISKKIHSTT